MNNQGMQFQQPGHAQEPYRPQPVNAARREEPTWQEGSFPEQEEGMGQSPYMGYVGEKIGVGPSPQRRRRRRHRGAWVWILLIVIALGIFGAGSGSYFVGFGQRSSVKETRYFALSSAATPSITITDDVGYIHIHAGISGSASIQATKQSEGYFGNPNNVTVNYEQNGDSLTVAVNDNANFLQMESVNFDVTVPQNADLTLKTNTGNIDVNAVNGVLSLTSDTGSISATNATLVDSSTLKSDTGSITFNGTIDQGQTQQYIFETNTGSVNVTLPSSSAFRADGSTDTGSCNTTFPGLTTQHPNVTGCKLGGDVGNNPTTTVILRTDTGSMDLIKGP